MGINFRLGITAPGGEVVGSINPYNYTEKCWVNPDDAKAMKERWTIFEDACNQYDYAAVIQNYLS